MKKKGGTQIFEINIAGDVRTFSRFVLKKDWFLCGSTILGFQPDLDLGKDVRTPNSVWGKIPICIR